ncbi:lysophospholipid acyltransferase family protein [Candidatus Magnetaquicoccus inordinatus]|uniref:lysophospholipid acyltransferase family protein n=1 Tax=Candidatus Magnetaquicoccus inordinatus TaxID=2496818 RepID=UPI00102B7E78|nr:lysophospholipid acyltransferase family protein [Candidatus Magnetaquicoccus inordinatus]
MATTLNPPQGVRWRHRLEWLLLRSLVGWLQQGDLGKAYRRVARLSPLLRHVLRSEWAWSNTNLQWVYGNNLQPRARERLAALVMENIMRSLLEGLRPDPCQISAGAEQAQTLIQEALQQQRGLIVCSTHLGSWEMGVKWIATLGQPIHVVYRHANNPLSEQIFMAARAHYGVHWIRRDELVKMLRVLQKKEILLLMTDINQRRDGIVAPFLGIPALCPAGPARLAQRRQIPLLPLACLRDPEWGRFRILSAPMLAPLADESEEALTTRINQQFEPWITAHPEQYNWLHARWRSRPDGCLWSADTPAEQLLQARLTPPLLPPAALLQRVNS